MSGGTLEDTMNRFLRLQVRKWGPGDYYLVVAPNGRAVVCKLNDRGPYVAGRVIDLSHAAIHELHESDGLIPVKVYLLGGHPPGQLGRRGPLHSRVNK